MIFFDGRKEAALLDEKIQQAVEVARSTNQEIGKMAIIQVGENAESEKYISLKQKVCEKFGIVSCVYKLNASLSDAAILEAIKYIFDDSDISGGIIQLPLPRPSLNNALNLIPVSKDIDLISPKSLNNYYNGDFAKLSPVIRAFDLYINKYNLKLIGTKVTIIGEGNLVGKPLKYYLSKKGAQVTALADYKKGYQINCQLLVLSAGVPALVNGDDIIDGCNVVDFGSSIVEGRTIGDLDLRTPVSHLGYISPSPGGIGPLVIRFLILNFLHL